MPNNKNQIIKNYTIKDNVVEIDIKRTNEIYTILVDVEDLQKVLEMGKWYVSKPSKHSRYAEKRLTPRQFEEINSDRKARKLPELKVTTLLLHRYILDLDCKDTYNDIVVDHIDGNGLNNCKSNLRLCNRSQNSCNKRLHSNSQSGYKGVSFIKRTFLKKNGFKSQVNVKKPWLAYIRPKGQKRIHIGCYETAEEAAKAYDEKAKELFGEFAKLNDI